MAKEYSYRPYTTKQVQGRRVKMIMLVLIVVIVGLVILIKSQTHNSPAPSESTQPPRVSLDEVLPPSPQRPTPAEAPAPSPVALPVQSPPLPEQEAVVQNAPVQTDVIEAEEPNIAKDAVLDEGVDQTSPEAQQLIEQALKLRDAGKFVAARDLLNESLRMQLSPTVRVGVKTQMAQLSEIWLFDRGVMEGDKMTGHHLVQPGELLSNIGKQYKIPYELLLKINKLQRPELLRAGQRIKVVHGPFNAQISRSTFTMDVYLQNVLVKSYKVGLGRSEHTTPTGRWLVASGGKMIKPTWTDPDTFKTYLGTDPDYPLGSRWIALDGVEGAAKGRTGFAIHGTKEPETIGTQSSRGCIRLFNGDVIEVYDLMEPGQSNVIVMD